MVLHRGWRGAMGLGASLCFLFLACGYSPSGAGGRSLDEWAAWRDAEIKKILAAGADGVVSRDQVILRSVEAYQVLAPYLDDAAFLRDRGLEHFAAFVKGQSQMARIDSEGGYAYSLGFDRSDRDYWMSAARELKFPPLLRSEAFLRALSSPSTYGEAMGMISAENAALPEGRKWVALVYRSQFLKSADKQTYGRFLVVVPNEATSDGETVDRWIQFAIEVPGEPVVESKLRSVSVITVWRGGGGRSRAYLADFMRDRDPVSGRFSIVPTMLEKSDPSHNCYECHKSAVLPILPKKSYGFDAQGKLLEQALGDRFSGLNKMIAGYGQCSMPMMDMGAFGPSAGPVGRARTDEFIRGVAKDSSLSAESCERIREAMSCGSCHRDSEAINYPQAVRNSVVPLSFEGKIGLPQVFVEGGQMPPGNLLTPAERGVLWRCLEREYYEPVGQTGILVDWLRGLGPG